MVVSFSWGLSSLFCPRQDGQEVPRFEIVLHIFVKPHTKCEAPGGGSRLWRPAADSDSARQTVSWCYSSSTTGSKNDYFVAGFLHVRIELPAAIEVSRFSLADALKAERHGEDCNRTTNDWSSDSVVGLATEGGSS